MPGMLFLALLFEFIFLIFLAGILYYLMTGFIGVPWVPSTKKYRDIMFDLAKIQPGERILDIGCGDGIIVCDAVKRFQAIGYGIEYHYLLMLCGRIRALITGVSSKTHFIWGNMYRMQYPEADVIFTYLFPETNKRLEPLLKASFPSGTRVVSRAFSYPTLPLITKKQEGRETIYLYQIP
ncbi:hypothetical protein A2239_02535 [Candidatus Uhrbacteria bacterium RIFOXYA2_FULL_40_9]|nr:MAG: hypothetical protein UT94_C0002G0016 [Candidatus Uhrbacteria bacterium GW2011_GWF2_40_263]OGL93953.1 MAG: hypothetical protein A2239_02535 [Candidatus Uhrbacteria bacterium RIFOXYA2_FULL_40_9]OGL97398.1 MAG: hypothetical protein A2332_04745 [Candidatus Uhrbacteria bacterium RIFOXYB2_FULL_41_18]HBK35011.1 hypothetical protein [Candidatus Uhrbacteria bacterium]HCB56165.1 hypothetical protein [Candidatus Uhrbacteria bacterium]